MLAELDEEHWEPAAPPALEGNEDSDKDEEEEEEEGEEEDCNILKETTAPEAAN